MSLEVVVGNVYTERQNMSKRKCDKKACRRLGEDFLEYLWGKQIDQSKWTREELELKYTEFCTERKYSSVKGFGSILFQLSRKPARLKVRGGTKIIFTSQERRSVGIGSSTTLPIQNSKAQKVRSLEKHPGDGEIEKLRLPAPSEKQIRNQKNPIKKTSTSDLKGKTKINSSINAVHGLTRGNMHGEVINKHQAKKQRRVIPGIKPTRNQNNSLSSEFVNYRIPPGIKQAMKEGLFYKSGCYNNHHFKLLKNDLNSDNHHEKFHLLLYLEEWQYTREMDKFSMVSTMSKESGLLYLTVPGLAEKRPSLLKGDRVYVERRQDGKNYGDIYEGFVHEVEMERVGLGFDKKLIHIFANGMRFHIHFKFNKFPLNLMHRALDLCGSADSALKDMLFPVAAPAPLQIGSFNLIMFNRHIQQNEEQSRAVHNIVSGSTSHIYIIFGPPGTGKTVTVVESIKQLFRKEPNFHILVCALSNSACDLITERLLDSMEKRHIYRMHASSRSWKSVPQKIREVSNYTDGAYVYPPLADLMKYRVIICTFVSAGRLSLAEFPKNHFSRIFIDEAGQALEPECLVAISGVIANQGKVVLAGDPKQLGPIIRSPLALENGLQQSLLERLMNSFSIYQKQGEVSDYNPQCVTKLLKNYRSHKKILKVPNEEFYENELMACANIESQTLLCDWEELPNKDVPIIFHGTEGKQMRDKLSPSLFNPNEVKIVKTMVTKLLEKRRGRRILPKEIGIITPYRRQVEKIRQAVSNPDIQIGSVEEFQGQERLVIIISTVRSNTDYLAFDAKHHLGFLRDPKRFNVAITRAKSLLIVIGNPRILCMDKYWGLFLMLCLQNKAYRGVKFSLNDMIGQNEELNRLFAKLSVDSDQDECNIEDQTNPHWRQDP